MTPKKILVSSAVALSMLAMGTVAFANSSILAQKAVAIDGSGNVALAGTVTAVSASTISVNSWLGTWVVNTTNANVQVGDSVKVAGTLGTGLTVNATAVKNSSIVKKTLTGTIGNLNATAGTFTLATQNSGTVNVTTSGSTQIKVDGNVVAFASLTNGSKANVSGTLNTTTNTITADSIKVPATENHTKADFRFKLGAWFNKFFKR